MYRGTNTTHRRLHACSMLANPSPPSRRLHPLHCKAAQNRDEDEGVEKKVANGSNDGSVEASVGERLVRKLRIDSGEGKEGKDGKEGKTRSDESTGNGDVRVSRGIEHTNNNISSSSSGSSSKSSSSKSSSSCSAGGPDADEQRRSTTASMGGATGGASRFYMGHGGVRKTRSVRSVRSVQESAETPQVQPRIARHYSSPADHGSNAANVATVKRVAPVERVERVEREVLGDRSSNMLSGDVSNGRGASTGGGVVHAARAGPVQGVVRSGRTEDAWLVSGWSFLFVLLIVISVVLR